MKFSRLSDAVLNRNSVWALLLVLIIFLYAGCGGNDDSQVLPNLTGSDKVTSFGDLTKVTVKDMALTDKNADEYYARLEKILNGEYSSLSNAPKKAAGTPYLTNMVLSLKTDEVQAMAAYDLATKITATANFSDGTTEVVTPTWMVYSGPATLVNNIYTAQAAAGQTVFIAYYTRDGVTRFVIFRLTVNSMSLLDLSMAADAVQASGNYDLSAITVYAKSSNGTSKDVTAAPNTKWSLLSGRGTLNGNIYTAPAMADTAIFLVRYTEAGVIESAQFTLKINGLTAVSLNKTTDEIQLPETYDLGSELIVSAKYSSGSTLEVTHAPGLIWTLTSGSGTLAGTVYTPTAKVETAVFTGSYTEAGITKTTTFQLKAIGLTSLSLNKTTDEVQSCANYSLADNLILTDKLSNGTTTNRTMDPNTKWTLVSGRGALNGMVYTAPALAETAVIAASYTEAGITKTINFRLRVNALISLTLSKTTDETVISSPYDIASKLTVFAKFSSGQTKEVTTSPNLRWTISFGSGALNGAIYTTPERIETAVIVATYTENGVAQSARFSLKVSAVAPGTKVLLVGLTINKTTDSVQLFDGTYNLGSLAATGKYSDKTTREVTLSWIVTSGGGSVAGNIFTAPANVGTVQLMGSCIAEDGSVKSVYFTLKASNDTIDKVSALIGPEGGSLTLSKGITLKIPANATTVTTEVVFSQVKNEYFKSSCQNILEVNSSAPITNSFIKIPITSETTTEITAALVEKTLTPNYLNAYINQAEGVYVISLVNNSNNVNVNYSPNRGIGGGGNNTTIIYEVNAESTYERYRFFQRYPSVTDITMPFYQQYRKENYFDTLLMYLKGHTLKGSQINLYNSAKKVSTIHDMLQSLSKNKDVHQIPSKASPDSWEEYWYGKGLAELVIEDVINNNSFEPVSQPFLDLRDGVDDMLYALKEKTPVIIQGKIGSLLIIGYRLTSPLRPGLNPPYPMTPVEFMVHDPMNSKVNVYYRWDTIISLCCNHSDPWGRIIYNYKKPPAPFTNSLCTIQLPDGDPNPSPPINKVTFSFKSQEIAVVKWNHVATYGYEIMPLVQNTNTSEFDTIQLKNIHLYCIQPPLPTPPMNYIINVDLYCSKFDPNGQVTITRLCHYDEQSNLHDYLLKKCDISMANCNLSNIVPETSLLLKVEVRELSSNLWLDGFDVKFKYTPRQPKKLFSPDNKNMNLNTPYQMKLFYGTDDNHTTDVAKLVDWTLESGTIDNNCNYLPGKIGTFKITARLNAGTVIEPTSEIVEDAIEISFYLSVYDAFIYPPTASLGTNGVCSLQLKYGVDEVTAPDFTSKAIWSVLPGGKLEFKDDKMVFTPPNAIGIYTITALIKKEDGFGINDLYKTSQITFIPDLTTSSSAASNIEFMGNNVQYQAYLSNLNVTNQAVWKVENPDSNVQTDGQGIFANGLLKTKGEITAQKEYFITVTYEEQGIKTSQQLKIKFLPGIIPSKKAILPGQSCQFKLGTDIIGEPLGHLEWRAPSDVARTLTYTFVPPENGGDKFINLVAVLYKGTTLSSGEILDTDLFAHAVIGIHDLHIEPQKNIIDINETCQFKLQGTTDIANLATWSCNSGTISIASGQAIYTPSKAGTDIITAKLAGGTLIPLSYFGESNIIESDIEITAEITVVEIKILETMPLIARVEPVDAAGKPMTDVYRISQEFTVSVDGANVPIDMPYIKEGSDKGTITHISTSDTNVLPVIYKYKFNPPPPSTTEPYFFDADDYIHINIKSPQLETISVSAEAIVYKPVFRPDVTANYESGQISSVGDYVLYTNGPQIYVHGNYKTYRDNVSHSLERSGKFKYGENIGLHYYYEASGMLGGWYDYYDQFHLHAKAVGYYFEYTNENPPVKITKTRVFELNRASIYVPYTYTLISTNPTPGWAPASPLPPGYPNPPVTAPQHK